MNLGGLFEGPHLLIGALLLFFLFGAKKLPELGKGIGEGLKGFKEGIKGVTDPVPTVQAQTAVPAQPVAPAVEQKQTPVA